MYGVVTASVSTIVSPCTAGAPSLNVPVSCLAGVKEVREKGDEYDRNNKIGRDSKWSNKCL